MTPTAAASSLHEAIGRRPWVAEAEAEINGLLAAMLAGKPADRSDEVGLLTERAAKQLETNGADDIEDWAKKLANDLSQFTD